MRLVTAIILRRIVYCRVRGEVFRSRVVLRLYDLLRS